eukprot:PhF_6_TR18588/c0_g2_i2/m.27154
MYRRFRHSHIGSSTLLVTLRLCSNVIPPNNNNMINTKKRNPTWNDLGTWVDKDGYMDPDAFKPLREQAQQYSNRDDRLAILQFLESELKRLRRIPLNFVETLCKNYTLPTDIDTVDKFFEKYGKIVYQPNTRIIGSITSVGGGVVRRHEPYKDVPIVEYDSPDLIDSSDASYVVVVHGESGSGKTLNSIRAAAKKAPIVVYFTKDDLPGEITLDETKTENEQRDLRNQQVQKLVETALRNILKDMKANINDWKTS